MSIKPGIRLGDRYQLLTPIATGGMGQVWRAEDTTLHRVVAAKILRSEFSGDETFLARFRAEARNTASLSHPNIASVYDYGEQVHDSERLCYLVMELVAGKPLVDILAQERRLSPSRTLDYLEQTALGLAAAHREGMVHRDIKPGNLIIRPDGVLKITDFGIARAANAVGLTEQGTVVGTAQYLAPEQAEGKPARPASDVYALGVVGYECLAGVRPFDGDNSVAIALAQIRDLPRPLPADVPHNVRTLIELTMRKNPDARYPDGRAFVAAVKAVREGGMPTAPPSAPATAPAPPHQLPGGPRPDVPPRGPGGPGAPAGPGGPAGRGAPAGPGGPTGPGGPGASGGPDLHGAAGPTPPGPRPGPAGRPPAPQGPAAPQPYPAAPRAQQPPMGGPSPSGPSGAPSAPRHQAPPSPQPSAAPQPSTASQAPPTPQPSAMPQAPAPTGGLHPPTGGPPTAGGPSSATGSYTGLPTNSVGGAGPSGPAPPGSGSGATAKRSLSAPEQPSGRRTPWVLLTLAVLVLIAIVVAIVLLVSSDDDPDPVVSHPHITVHELKEEPR
ncbi:serine/threonine-protein kinase [Blastococcus sp. Marseille-P5729]|uniref:serine/threonine-protein kinase n=1 Tax=Blastococcus sp. Marseille-P5729 TaxID=2086582 RepID=UPI0018FE6462|nr:serine/threonine-protein kinase [Blastococcus sp. Marseille-P5729]